MNTFTKLILWIYYFIISIIFSIIFVISSFIQIFLQIFTNVKIDFFIDFNFSLIRQMSKIAFFTSFDEFFEVKNHEIFNDDPDDLFLNFISIFLLVIFLPIYFGAIIVFSFLKLFFRSKIDRPLAKLIEETDKIFLQLIGYPMERNFYYSNFNVLYFLFSSILLYFFLSRPAFYGATFLSSFIGLKYGFILGNVLGAILTVLYFLAVFPHFFGSSIDGSINIFTKDNIGIKKIGLVEFVIAFLVIMVFIVIMTNTFQQYIPSAIISYDYSNLLPYVSFAFIAGLLEETYFRGFILTFLTEANDQKKIILPIILSALTFGFAHSINLFYGSTVAELSFQIYDAFLFGLLVGLIYYKTKSLWPGIIIHTAIDAYSLGFRFTYYGSLISDFNRLVIENIGWSLSLVSLLLLAILIVLALNYREKTLQLSS